MSTQILMTADEFVAKAKNIASNYKTSYMLGPWGWPTTDKMINRACNDETNGASNRTWLSYANKIKNKGFLFDCVGLIKGILWGWNGDLTKSYGGAGYAINTVPDYEVNGMLRLSKDVSTDFSTIVPGEAVFMSGHIGIYVGGGMVVESTPKWNWGVQYSTCTNVSSKKVAGTVGTRKWVKHGKLPWIDYSKKPAAKPEKEDVLKMSRDELKALIRSIVIEVYNELNPMYGDLKDVPSYWQGAAKKLLDADVVNGGTNKDTCATDLNLRQETLKAVVISQLFHDSDK